MKVRSMAQSSHVSMFGATFHRSLEMILPPCPVGKVFGDCHLSKVILFAFFLGPALSIKHDLNSKFDRK